VNKQIDGSGLGTNQDVDNDRTSENEQVNRQQRSKQL
jgi:hypothetical protein